MSGPYKILYKGPPIKLGEDPRRRSQIDAEGQQNSSLIEEDSRLFLTSEAVIGSLAGIALGSAFIIFLLLLLLQMAVAGFFIRRKRRREERLRFASINNSLSSLSSSTSSSASSIASHSEAAAAGANKQRPKILLAGDETLL